MLSILAISSGAVLGALLRWQLTNWLNPIFTNLAFGTLSANLIGAYLAGIAVALFADLPNLSTEWRLFLITGFLGALTTFSTFALELVALLQEGKTSWAFISVFVHVIGSVLLVFIGITSFMLIKKAF